MGEHYLCFDYGTKRVGVAVGQRLTGTASPLEIIPTLAGKPNWPCLDTLIESWNPKALVVGVPLNMDGSEQPLTGKAKKFCNQLRNRYHLEVHEAEERLTTIEAKSRLISSHGIKKLHKGCDHIAAQIILESWFHLSSL